MRRRESRDHRQTSTEPRPPCSGAEQHGQNRPGQTESNDQAEILRGTAVLDVARPAHLMRPEIAEASSRAARYRRQCRPIRPCIPRQRCALPVRNRHRDSRPAAPVRRSRAERSWWSRWSRPGAKRIPPSISRAISTPPVKSLLSPSASSLRANRLARQRRDTAS